MAATTRYSPTIEELTEEVVFPLVRRRSRPLVEEEEESTSVISRPRVILVQTIGLVLFIAAFALLVLVWLRS